MKVFVLSQAGKPLMPTTPRRARRWLKKKQALVVRKDPFTIRLRFGTRDHVQLVSVGVDTGSKVVGIAATTNGQVVFQAEVHLRDDITEKLVSRRQYRRTRRSRKTRYRAARFANRRRPDGWLPPSTFGYETKYKRIEVLGLPKSHANDAVAIACEMGEVVKPLENVYQMRCLARGQYQRFNGPHSEHKCWAPRKVRGFKLYELVKTKGVEGYIAGRREKGSFVIKEVTSGKKLAEVTPRKLERRALPTWGWILIRQAAPTHMRKEAGASSSS